MKNGFPVIFIPLLLIVAFGVLLNVVDMNESSKPEKESHEKAETAQVESFDGESIYAKSCIGCHGDQYQGTVGPALKGLTYEQSEIEDILKNGKGGMPGNLVSAEDAPKMSEWLLTLK